MNANMYRMLAIKGVIGLVCLCLCSSWLLPTVASAANSPYAGIYMGEWQGDPGKWAMFVDCNGTGSFLGYNSYWSEGEAATNWTVNSNGTFDFYLIGGTTHNWGQITNSNVTGNWYYSGGGAITNGTFTGQKKLSAGIQQNAAGVYRGTFSGAMAGESALVLAADGTFICFSYVSSGFYAGKTDGGQGAVNATNQIPAFTTVNGVQWQGTLIPSSMMITGVWSMGGVGSGPFSLTRTQTPCTPTPVISWDAHESKVRPDGKVMLVWDRITDSEFDGTISLWRMSNTGVYETSTAYGPYPDWWLSGFEVGPDNKTWLLWDNYADNRISLWRMSTNGTYEASWTFGPYDGWWIDSMRVGADGKVRLLWRNYYDHSICLWRVSSNGVFEAAHTYGPFADWYPYDFRLGPDNKAWLLWENSVDGQNSLWRLSSTDVLETVNNYGPYSTWGVSTLDIGPDGKPRLLWDRYLLDHSASLWLLSTEGVYDTSLTAAPYAWKPLVGLVRPDNKTMLGWEHPNVGSDTQYAFWILGSTLGYELSTVFGPYTGWQIWGGSFYTDSKLHLLWKKDDGQISVWKVGLTGTIENTATYGPY